jgi:hypothetical protein
MKSNTKKRLVWCFFALMLGAVFLVGLFWGAPLLVVSRMFKTRLIAFVSAKTAADSTD